MPLYFMLHDAERFETLIRPALAASWRLRSFAPCASLRRALADDLSRYYAENYMRADESILLRIGSELHFGKDTWRLLVGEVLLIAAAELPEISVPEATFRLLLHRSIDEVVPRSRFVPLEQALYGARDLVFGGGWYRPDDAGYNDKGDVERLTRELDAQSLGNWTMAELAGFGENDEERCDELEFARACLVQVRHMYSEAQAKGQVIVCERL